MANIITSIRILCSIALFFVSPLSKKFYILYLAAGLSDMIDGPVARKTGTTSDLGSKLDSIADIIFVAVCLIKLISILNIEKWLYICYSVPIVCTVATIAAIQEVHFIRTKNQKV